MHAIWIVFLFALSADTGENTVHSNPVTDQVADAIRRGADAALDRVEVRPVEGSKGLYVAICDTQSEWWGEFRCLEYRAGKIMWTASFADGAGEPTEQSIRSVRGFRHPDFNGPLIEVLGTTHMGHGNYYLYELRARELHLLITTFAVDSHRDKSVIRGGALKAEYTDLNSDGRVDVTLSGTTDHFSDEYAFGERPVKSLPCRKVFLWDKSKGRFIEDVAKREGFGPSGR